jgi:hypothetical protein
MAMAPLLPAPGADARAHAGGEDIPLPEPALLHDCGRSVQA